MISIPPFAARQHSLTPKKLSMKCRVFIIGLVCAIGVPAYAAITPFTYTQTDKTTGSGTISGFTANGINFSATAMPAATVNDPGGAATPAAYVGSISGFAQPGDDTTYASANAVSLRWSGTVNAFGTDGVNNFMVPISLTFLPFAQNSGMNAVGSAVAGSDYGWLVNYGDDPTAGVDTISTSAPRVAAYFGIEAFPNYQRWTQNNPAFTAGQQTFSNTVARDGTTPIRDADDPNASGQPTPPSASDRPLAFAWAWRDQGALSQGSILVNDIRFDGYFWVDETAITPVPEPGTVGMVLLGTLILLRRRRVA